MTYKLARILIKVKGVQDLNTNELKSRVAGTSASWHEQYRHSAYIYVGGLDYNLTEGDIICIFSQFGEIMDLNMVRDKATGKAKGFCFIAYEDQRSTDLAVDNFNGAKVCGKTLSVDHVGKYRGPKPPGSDEDEPEEKISVAPADFVKLEKEKKKAKKAEKAAMKEGKAIQKKAKTLAKEARRAEKAIKTASRNSGKEGELSEKLGVSEEERQTIMARRAKLLEQATHISDSGSGSEKDPMEMMRKVAKNDGAYTDRTERSDVNTKRIENTVADNRHESKRRSRSRDGNARHTADMQHGKNRSGAKLEGEARNGEVTDRTTDEKVEGLGNETEGGRVKDRVVHVGTDHEIGVEAEAESAMEAERTTVGVQTDMEIETLDVIDREAEI
ncbi:hypothetical protein SARC_00203 [Sphaeroforma arctica JP610]|uniref:RRM domain-containing protein n=1 Tax=Sphaeroforma arctica JP610 TaxID=667725 RepID=A0A0L0GFB1_9EUKA|nr:hypothetical protein SARC_00203 [Sphaeroforma arctica JP610]KNC87697.1 hypothetical protein SARC_00203 [Sphaeroforma arctica JP610]|eukprot:XP_014161599.1 hypothetical protein SARC_00203 [Sphaeroforma arctica JP610]